MLSIKVPPLGESIVEAKVSRWLKQEGDSAASGETLVELETDKVTVEVPATKAGVLVKRLHGEGDIVKVDDILGELEEGAQLSGGRRTSVAERQETTAPAQKRSDQQAQTTGVEPSDLAVRSSPSARRLAAEGAIDLRDVPGTGRGGVVSKPDVIEYSRRSDRTVFDTFPTVPAPEPTPEPSAPPQPEPTPSSPPPPERPRPKPDVDVVRPEPPREALLPFAAPAAFAASDRERRETMSTRRKRIAEHLLEAQHSTAHLTTFNEIDMAAIEALRSRLKERIEKEHGVRLTFMPFFVRAACLALKQFPMVNAQVDGDDIVYHDYVNMGIAVASDAGLVVPNVKDADRKGMLQVAGEIADVAKRARDGKLTMDDLTGGTFTITNGGVFGSLVSTPIINYPQAAILGLHKIQDRPVALAGKVEVRPMMYVALSYDHRIIDGQQAVLFLVRVKELMEDPGMMVVD
jgi:2-oxoglutarate dehydrogenase E2 component (dihydrolipoamide succinyltransferase)